MLPNCNSSLRVPALLAYDLSSFDVILLLFSFLVILLLFSFLVSPHLAPIYPNYNFTLFIQFRRYCETFQNSQEVTTLLHIALIGSNTSIFMENRNIENIAQFFCNCIGNSGSHDFSVITD